MRHINLFPFSTSRWMFLGLLAAMAPACGHPAKSGNDAAPSGSGGSNNNTDGGPTGSGGNAGNSGAGGSEMPIADGGMIMKVACGSSTTKPLPYTSGYTPDPAVHTAAMTVTNSLSVSEKAQQMRGLTQSGTANYNVFRQEDNTSKGIKAFLFRDGPRGVNLNANGDGKSDYSTAFPVAIARGAAFDVDLEYHVGQAHGDELLASGNTMLLAPTVNILRHPGWGRAQETYGEDPFLLGRLGSAYTIGVQEYAAACAKHYAANNIENGRATATAVMDEQTLHEIYARHFDMIINDGGVACIMAAYNLVQSPGNPGGASIKSTQNRHLLNDLLRTEFGFKGFVLSDWWAMPNGNSVPLPAAGALQDAAATAINAGMDMELPWNYNYSTIESLVSSSRLTETQIATSVARILEQKMRFKVDKIGSALGLKTPTTTYNASNASIQNDQTHLALAETAALESMVLLKNDANTLPIDRTKYKNVAVIGANVSYIVNVASPEAGRIDFSTNVRTGDLGSSRVFADPAKSVGPFAGIQMAAGAGVTVTRGNDVAAAMAADFVVVVAGLTPQDEGEEYTMAGDRKSGNFLLDAKAAVANQNLQNGLIMAVANLTPKKPMVVVLEGGSVIDMPWKDSVPAIVMAWYPGMVGGKALGKLLFGDVNFSGKLPLTWPAAWGDEPVFVGPSGSTQMDYYLGYRYFENSGKTPLYWFGYGKSYNPQYTYSNVQAPCTTVAKDGVVNVTVDVTNKGDRKGDEIAFLFVSYPGSTARRPAKELKGFTRFTLEKPDPASPLNGSSKRITSPLRVADLKYWDTAQNKWVVASGMVKVMVGASANNADLTNSDTFIVN
jgi:beta-glucosidase